MDTLPEIAAALADDGLPYRRIRFRSATADGPDGRVHLAGCDAVAEPAPGKPGRQGVRVDADRVAACRCTDPLALHPRDVALLSPLQAAAAAAALTTAPRLADVPAAVAHVGAAAVSHLPEDTDGWDPAVVGRLATACRDAVAAWRDAAPPLARWRTAVAHALQLGSGSTAARPGTVRAEMDRLPIAITRSTGPRALLVATAGRPLDRTDPDMARVADWLDDHVARLLHDPDEVALLARTNGGPFVARSLIAALTVAAADRRYGDGWHAHQVPAGIGRALRDVLTRPGAFRHRPPDVGVAPAPVAHPAVPTAARLRADGCDLDDVALWEAARSLAG